MNQQQAIEVLEPEWEHPNGFFAKLRSGHFAEAEGDRVLEIIKMIDVEHSPLLNRRLVSLLWYLPLFCSWQEDRVRDEGGDVESFSKFITRLNNELEEKLGVP